MQFAQLLLLAVVLSAVAVQASALECGNVFDGPYQRDASVIGRGRSFSPSWNGFHDAKESDDVRTEWAVVSAKVANRMDHLTKSCDSVAAFEPDVVQWTRHADEKQVRQYLPAGKYHTLVRVTHKDGDSKVRMSDGFMVTKTIRSVPSVSKSTCDSDANICRARWERSNPNGPWVPAAAANAARISAMAGSSGGNGQGAGAGDGSGSGNGDGAGDGDSTNNGMSVSEIVAFILSGGSSAASSASTNAADALNNGLDASGNVVVPAGFEPTSGGAFFSPAAEFAEIVEEEENSGLSGGQIAGIVIGCVAAALLILIIIAVAVTSGGKQRFTGSGPSASRDNVDA